MGQEEDEVIKRREHRRKYLQLQDVQEKRKEYIRKYNQSQKAKESRKRYAQKPETKEKLREYYQRPEVKEKLREYGKKYYQKSYVKQRLRVSRQTPEYKAKRRDYERKRNANFHVLCQELSFAGDFKCMNCDVRYSKKLENEWIAKQSCPCCHKKLRNLRNRLKHKVYIE